MKLFRSKPEICLALTVAALISTTITFWPLARSTAFYFEVTIRSSLPGFAQLFYDVSSGLNESDSHRLPIEGGNRDVRYKFPLPDGRCANLRFDPTNRPESIITLSDARITDWRGHVLQAIGPNQFKVAHQIERFEADATGVTLTTAAGDGDSNLNLELSPPLVLTRVSWESITRSLPRFVPWFFASAALLLLAPTLLKKAKPASLRWIRKAATWIEVHPNKAVLVTGALLVILSCYPVVFFGKSFVSPNNHSHTYLLYGKMPTVPGYEDVATDDEKGSDLGAAMWQNWPYSVVQGRSLFKDGELPLWNRYNSCGLPLLGQGLSMCADPFQLLVLFGGSSGGAWDLKYVLAKFLFASCVGLCVLQTAKHLPAALIITATAPFIGFFSYRYAHPAFFALCYAPSVLLCWFKLIDARPGKETAAWLAAMVVADWTLITSGAVKEAYILLLAMNFCGFLAVLSGHSIVGGRARKFWQAFFATLLFAAIAMPVWFTFFHVLQNSLTQYDAGGAWQLQPGLLIGLFDDIFYRQFNAGENHLDPSLSFLALLGILWFLASSRSVDQRGFSKSLGITCILALLFVFGVVPQSMILRVPFLRNIFHIDNTFSNVAIVCLLVIAGFGVKAFWSDCQATNFKRTYLGVIALVTGMAALYLGTTEAAQRSTIALFHPGERLPKSAFFWGYFLSLMIAVAVTPWLARRAIVTKPGRVLQVFFLAMLFILFHWRHGMHLTTPFDAYVMNPQRRVKLVAESSPALRLVKTRVPEPSRSVGLDSAFFPGYGGAVGVEQIDGPDPLLNRHYRALMQAWGVKLLFGGWRFGISDEPLGMKLPLFNMLNIRYFLGDVGTKTTEPDRSLRQIASLDLNVFESEDVWPRAFFTDRLVTYDHEEEFVALLKNGDGAPFAAMSNADVGKQEGLTEIASTPPGPANRKVIPARNYVLTSNTTSFKVAAPGPGVVVLTEAYVPGDFKLRLNGQQADYFRVNSAFKGVFVQKAGDYIVSYVYWPRYFTFSLLVAGAGVIALLGWLAVMTRGGIRSAAVS